MFWHKRKSSLKNEIVLLKSLLIKIWKLKITKIILILLVIIFIIPIVLFYVYRPLVSSEINYGVTFSKKYAQEMGLDWKDSYIKILDDMGVKNLRLIAYWDDIEKVQGVYDFSDIKWQLAEAQKRDAKVILSLGRKVPRWPECFEPAWWNSIPEEDIRDYHLLKYIESTTRELKQYDNINMWQVENEPFFLFGLCKYPIKSKILEKEISMVRSLDSRPIIIQDSGEGGYWFPSYKKGDYLAISMYRKVLLDFWAVLFKRFVYFQYPLPDWSYKLKAFLTLVPADKIIVSELQAEPWGGALNSTLTEKEKSQTMSRTDFHSVIAYAQKSGFKNIYFWGVEWWLWEKEKNNNPFYWDTAKAVFN